MDETQEPRPLDVLLMLEDDELTDDEKTILNEYLDEQTALKAEYARVNSEISENIDVYIEDKQTKLDEVKDRCKTLYNASMENETVENLRAIYE